MLIIGAVVAGAVAGLFVPGLVRRVPAGGRLLAWPDRVRPDGWILVAAIAALWGAFASVLGSTAELPAFLYLAWLGVALGAIDICCHRLPDVLVLPSYPIGAVLLGIAAIVDADGGAAVRALGGGVLLAAGYYAIAFLKPGGIGLGDVKLAGLLGLHLAWLDWSAVVVGTLVAFTAGALVAVGLLAAGRADRSSRMPFGPFMLAGAAIGIVIAA